jgi:predicted nucleic acid-binding protein
MVLRVTYDVNVWVAHFLSLSKGRQGTAAQRVIRSAFAGHCRLGSVQPIISHTMLDTMQGVLIRRGLTEVAAEAARNAVESSAADGVVPQPPYMLPGGGVQPMNDSEDGGVLDTAAAGGADLLMTSNLQDFAPGPRSGIDAEIVRLDADGDADVLLFRHGRLAHGVVIASLFAATAWLLDGARPPDGILERFLPPEPNPRLG